MSLTMFKVIHRPFQTFCTAKQKFSLCWKHRDTSSRSLECEMLKLLDTLDSHWVVWERL